MLTKIYLPITRQARHIVARRNKVKLGVKMDDEIGIKIANEDLKPRKHPGRVNSKLVELPAWLSVAAERSLEEMPKSTVLADAINLANFLKGRHPPTEETALQTKYAEIRSELAARRKLEKETEKTAEDLENDEKRTGLRLLKRAFHVWSPVRYNRYAGLLYLVSRSAQEYAVLHKIFHEILTRDENFRPKSLLDFGSGVGTVNWVASCVWPRSIKEHVCVDISDDMFDLSESIAGYADPKIGQVFRRRYIPFSNRTYDMAISSYTLLELPNMQTRLDAIAKLWARAERYLVIVEQGTNAGFKLINEARDFILHLESARSETKSRGGYIFSPCPHELKCPRYRADDTPCNFEVSYSSYKIHKMRKSEIERFSYIVFKKGDPREKKNWPRLVRPTLVRSKHTICRMCTADGRLSEIIFTAAKHGKCTYRCAKASKWGDRLPMETKLESIEKERNENESTEREDEKEEVDK